jgi:hypothetical protein
MSLRPYVPVAFMSNGASTGTVTGAGRVGTFAYAAG